MALRQQLWEHVVSLARDARIVLDGMRAAVERSDVSPDARLLVLGGTEFVGRAVVEEARAAILQQHGASPDGLDLG